MYKDPSPDAKDAIESSGLVDVTENIAEVCGGIDEYDVVESLDRIIKLKTNLKSPYMRASEIMILFQMCVCFFVCCIWIPFTINEY